MQSVLAEAKAILSETQPHPTSSSLSVWALFPSAGLDGYLPQWRRAQAPPLAQPACCGYLLFSDCTSLDSGCF